MKKFLPASKNGFTLIELLVVITIIAVLSVIGFVVYSGISARARDTRRMAEIDAIQKAMESNYKPGAASPYAALSNADFVNGAVPKDPLSITPVPATAPYGKCGSGTPANQQCDYCSFTTVPIASWNTCTGIGVNVVTNGVPAAGRSYIVCANLETGAGFEGRNYYCKVNAQ